MGETFGAPPHEAVCRALGEIGLGEFRNDIAGQRSDTYCFFERYNHERFATADADGNVTLDYGNYITAWKALTKGHGRAVWQACGIGQRPGMRGYAPLADRKP